MLSPPLVNNNKDKKDMLSSLLLKPFLRQDVLLSCLSPIKNYFEDIVLAHVVVFVGILSLLYFFY